MSNHDESRKNGQSNESNGPKLRLARERIKVLAVRSSLQVGAAGTPGCCGNYTGACPQTRAE